jgi:hypothetical protein
MARTILARIGQATPAINCSKHRELPGAPGEGEQKPGDGFVILIPAHGHARRGTRGGEPAIKGSNMKVAPGTCESMPSTNKFYKLGDGPCILRQPPRMQRPKTHAKAYRASSRLNAAPQVTAVTFLGGALIGHGATATASVHSLPASPNASSESPIAHSPVSGQT